MENKLDKNQIIMALRTQSEASTPNKNFKKNLGKELTKNFPYKKNFFEKVSENIFKNRSLFVGSTLVVLLAIVLVSNLTIRGGATVVDKLTKVNDWQYYDNTPVSDFFSSIGNTYLYKNSPMANVSLQGTSADMGFATGGAKDVNNFRENIRNGYLPIPTDITYEGLYYNYYFDTGKSEPCTRLFCPSYSFAVSPDPFSKQTEYYMTVGLNSGLKESDFKRKPLNLVVVLDISGSMSSPFDQYYYDRFGNKVNQESSIKTKIDIAKETIVEMTKKLNNDDNFGMVLFDDQAYVGKPLSNVGRTEMDGVRNDIMKIQPRGGTNMSAGMEKGKEIIDTFLKKNDTSGRETRIVFLTDAMPNTGYYSEEALDSYAKKYADEKIYSTFIGIGVDFNTELVESMTKIRGANYFSVHNRDEFKKVLDEDFDLMVTPLVFDLNLNFESRGFKIEKVFGSPEANEATGSLMKVNTLFPSRSKDGEVKGGIVLLKLKKVDGIDDNTIKLSVSYEDRNGNKNSETKQESFKDKDAPPLSKILMLEYYQNEGIQKAVLLTRYTNLMKDWLIQTNLDQKDRPVLYDVNTQGISIPEYLGIPLPSKWERTSKKLQVSQSYKEAFKKFKDEIIRQNEVLKDSTLQQEIEILEKLINS